MNDFVLVPGQRIGPLTFPAKEVDVVRAFPGKAYPEEVSLPEGGVERVTLLYPCDPIRQAYIRYETATRNVQSIEVGQPDGRAQSSCARHLAGVADPMLKGQQPGDVIDYDVQNRYRLNHHDDFPKSIESRAERAMTTPGEEHRLYD